MHTLIVYQSYYGSTAQMARWISQRIGGIAKPVSEVTSIDEYDLIIIGTPIYCERPLDEIQQFVERYRDGLSNKATAVYAACLDTEEIILGGRHVGPITSLQPLVNKLPSPPLLVQGLPGEVLADRLTQKHRADLEDYLSVVSTGSNVPGIHNRTYMDKSRVWRFAERVQYLFDKHAKR